MTSDAELREATGRRARYFARGVYSRGGVCCLTNTGPLAGALEMDEVHPTPASPWLVQPFLDGETVCTYSTAHQGRVSSHLMCRVPRQRKHSTGIQFQAIDATESLKLVEPIVATPARSPLASWLPTTASPSWSAIPAPPTACC